MIVVASIFQQAIFLTATIELQRMRMQPAMAVKSRCAGPRRSQAAASRDCERAALSVLPGLVAERAALAARNAALVTLQTPIKCYSL